MSPPLKIGLVGCGAHATSHVGGFRALRNLVRVTAVCDLDSDRARKRADELRAEAVYTDYDDFLDDSGVDAVTLCLPHDQHAPATIKAAAAGKHILVEKPIARTLAEADAMIEAARSAGVVFMVAHNRRYHPEHRRIRELLDERAIGRVYCAKAEHNQDFQPPAAHWIRKTKPAGGGAMIGYGIHLIDLLRWLVGDVVEIAHFQVHATDAFEGETSAVSILRFADGAIGEISVNWAVRAAPWMDMLYLYGTSGSIQNVGGLHLESGQGVEGSGTAGRVDVPPGDAFAEQIRHFAYCVLENRTPLTSGPEARKSLEVCLAAYRAAETGQITCLPLVDEDVAKDEVGQRNA